MVKFTSSPCRHVVSISLTKVKERSLCVVLSMFNHTNVKLYPIRTYGKKENCSFVFPIVPVILKLSLGHRN